MDLGTIDGAGDDLHRLRVCAVATNGADTPFAGPEHRVPGEQGLMREGRAEILVEVHHHLGDAALGRRNSPPVGAEPELLEKGRLDAVAIEDFAFNLRGFHGLVGDQLDFESVLLVRPHMLEGADELPRTPQKLPFQRLQSVGIIRKSRPVGLLPVPGHEL